MNRRADDTGSTPFPVPASGLRGSSTDDALNNAQAAIASAPASYAPLPYASASFPATHGSSRRSGSLLRWLLVLTIFGTFGAAVAWYSTSNNAGGAISGMGRGAAGSWRMSDESWSYYHQSNIDSNEYAARWNKGINSITTASKWEYDGPYQYGTYGRTGMSARKRTQANGRVPRDPIYGGATSSDSLDDIFAEYGIDTADPTGGAPVGPAPEQLNPWYDPWATTGSNPYAQRLEMTWGDASRRDAWLR